MRHLVRLVLMTFVTLAAFARPASAQWYFAGYLGASFNRPATVSIDVPGANLSLEYLDVEFEARPFESPQYYGWRFGTLRGPARASGIEVEFTHLKVYARTAAQYRTLSTLSASTISITTPMNEIVERYSMSHGLNFVTLNGVVRRPAGRRAAVFARVGAGVTIAHTETTVLGGAVDRYEFTGFGAQAAGGLDVRLSGRLSFVADYKFNFAQPEISISGGTGRTTVKAHQITAGLAYGLSR